MKYNSAPGHSLARPFLVDVRSSLDSGSHFGRRKRLQTLSGKEREHNKKIFFTNLALFSCSFTFINGGCVHSQQQERTIKT